MLTRTAHRGLVAPALLTAVILAAACSPATENTAPSAEANAAPAAASAQNDEWADTDPAPQAQYKAPAPKPAPKPAQPKAPATANLPGGSEFEVMLVNEVASDLVQAGEPVEGRVVNSVRVNGRTVIPGGSRVEGVISEVQKARSIGGQAMVAVAGSAVGGAILGKVLGGESKDAAIGAVVGGGVGTAVAAKRGDEAILVAETMGWVKTLSSADLRIR